MIRCGVLCYSCDSQSFVTSQFTHLVLHVAVFVHHSKVLTSESDNLRFHLLSVCWSAMPNTMQAGRLATVGLTQNKLDSQLSCFMHVFNLWV